MCCDVKVLGYFINVKNKVSNEFSSENALNINREALNELLDNWLTKESLTLFKEQYSQTFKDAKLSRDVEDASSSAAENAGLKEGDQINEEWLKNFMKNFMNTDTIKNLLNHSNKLKKDKNSL